MKHRILRVCELLKREVSEVISRDFAFDGALVTVNSVDVTPDLKQAHVFVGVVAGRKKGLAGEQSVIDRLNKGHGFIQNRMRGRVILKYTPKLHFRLDRSVERGMQIVDLLESIEVPEDAPPTEPDSQS
ncbi:30S ribosome-binding factor RbfA [soil metagenome]